LAAIIIPGQSGTYRHLQDHVTGLLADSGQIAVPGRLVRHARHLILRLPPGHGLLPKVLARLRDLPVPA